MFPSDFIFADTFIFDISKIATYVHSIKTQIAGCIPGYQEFSERDIQNLFAFA
jgi:hypothetical protein